MALKTVSRNPFLLRQAQQIILDLLRPDPAETSDQFFEKAGFHAVLVIPSVARDLSMAREIPRIRSE